MSRGSDAFTVKSLKAGVVEKIFDMARRQCGIAFSVVFPRTDGWGHIDLRDTEQSTDFCRVIRRSKEGAKHCKMCHVLMSVAACSQGLTEQKCHAGATILVQPIEEGGEGGMAILTSCAFRHDEKDAAWKFVKQRGEQLGLEEEDLKKAFLQLPDLDDASAHCLAEIMPLAIAAIRELGQRMELENELKECRTSRGKLSAGEHLKQEFADVAEKHDESEGMPDMASMKGKKTPTLIKVVCSMVRRRPQIPYTVEELATAARMTPNYFSSIFHKHTGQCFMDYLTDQRIERAQKLLADLSLNVSEVASMCGYDDPGYFTRRFKRKTGMTPRSWREERVIRIVLFSVFFSGLFGRSIYDT